MRKGRNEVATGGAWSEASNNGITDTRFHLFIHLIYFPKEDRMSSPKGRYTN